MEFYDIGIQEYKQIINSIQVGYGFDFSYYSPITFRRKIISLMGFYQVDDLDELKFRIENSHFDEDFFRFFHVPITEMFRDPSFWRKIIHFILNNKVSDEMRVCFPGCVIGNELLSFLIVLQELKMEKVFEIIVTNPFPMEINSLVMMLEKRKFELSNTNFERLEFKNSNLEKYFNQDNKGNYLFEIDSFKKIKFVKHDFLKESLVEKQNLIFFRNQLLYFSIPNDEKIVGNMANSLKPKGLLFIGAKEKIENHKNFKLEIIDKDERIYKRIKHV